MFLFGAVFGALHATIMIVRFSYVQLWIRLSIEPNIVLAVMGRFFHYPFFAKS